MTTTSYGFAGSLGAADWAKMARYAGAYGIAAAGDWAVNAVSGQRAVSIAAGEAFGWNVRSVSDAAQTVNLPTPSAGQWFLIVATRDWSAKTTTVNYVAGATTGTTTPTVAPGSFPAINSTPGTLDDQPLAWAWVNNTSTVVTIFDVRSLYSTTLNKKLRYPSGGVLDPAAAIFDLASDIDAALSAAIAFGPADLNTYFTASGVYRGSGLTNAPGGSSGSFMVVVNYQASTLQTQHAYGLADGTLWYRSVNGGVWAAWARVTTAAELAVPTSLSTGADLNAISASGLYQGNSLVNAPNNTQTFFVWVIRRDGNGQAQLAINVNSGGMYYRAQTGGTWGAWVTVTDSNSTATAFGPADLNTYFTASGAFRGSNLTNAPGGSSGSFMVIVNYQDASTQTQTAVDMANRVVWNRRQNLGAWTSWHQFADDGNLPTLMKAAIDTSETIGAFTVASGWAIDSQDAFKVGGMADVAVVFHRTGGSITVPSNGNLSNQQVATFRTGWQPLRGRGLTGGGTGPMAQCVVAPGTGTGTGLILAALYSGASTINTGDSFSANGRFQLA